MVVIIAITLASSSAATGISAGSSRTEGSTRVPLRSKKTHIARILSEPMTAIADLPGPRRPARARQRAAAAARPPAPDDRALGRRYGPVFRFAMGPREVVGFTDPDTVNAILRERPHGYRRWREVEARGRRDRRDRAVHLRGRGLEAPAPARGDRAQHQPPAALLRRHPRRHRPPARPPGEPGRGRDPRRLHVLQRRRDLRAGVRARPQHARARRRRAAGPHRATSSSCSPAGSSRRSRTGACSSRRPTAPPSARSRSSRPRSPASSPRRARRMQERPGAARRARELPREHARRRPSTASTT